MAFRFSQSVYDIIGLSSRLPEGWRDWPTHFQSSRREIFSNNSLLTLISSNSLCSIYKQHQQNNLHVSRQHEQKQNIYMHNINKNINMNNKLDYRRNIKMRYTCPCHNNNKPHPHHRYNVKNLTWQSWLKKQMRILYFKFGVALSRSRRRQYNTFVIIFIH